MASVASRTFSSASRPPARAAATTKALQSVALGLLEEHMSHCVVRAAAAGGAEADEKIREATEAIARLVRS